MGGCFNSSLSLLKKTYFPADKNPSVSSNSPVRSLVYRELKVSALPLTVIEKFYLQVFGDTFGWFLLLDKWQKSKNYYLIFRVFS